MENHIFSEPTPVKDAPTPTWKVDVIRASGNVLVGTLVVNNENLPPRKNKKKIAWKLPDNYKITPKFGDHERKRLWELFKEQKKERRRQSKKLTSQLSSMSEGDKSESENPNDGMEAVDPVAPTPTANTTPDHSVAEDAGGPDDYGGDEAAADTAISAEKGEDTKSDARYPETRNDNAGPPPPPPGFNAEKLKAKTEKESPCASLPPPPPGLQSTTPPPPPPPGLTPTPDLALPPTLYFSLADDKPVAALGALVVPLFLQCVTTSTVAPWLAHSHPTLSQTTLALGSAQATGRTYIDRLQQWQSLTISNRWDCTGCTSQTLPLPHTVLLVLTGRTIQKQEWLAYHLSLILTASSTGTRDFQITNEILSLTALTNVPIPT